MKMQTRKNLTITISILIIFIIGLSVIYAALSTNLKVTASNVTQNIASWNVGFVAGTVNATEQGTSATGRSCGTATVTANSVSVSDSTLTKPGDVCYWPVTVKNSGSINAKVGSINTTMPSGISCTGANTGQLVCGNITYWLWVPQQNSVAAHTLAVNETLASGASMIIQVWAEYRGTALSSTTVKHTGLSYSVSWSQN